MTRTALITGASRGLGAALARFLAAEGYDLILTARHREALNSVVAEVRSVGATATGVAGDVSDATHRTELFERVAAGNGLDLLVNNASDLGPTPLPGLVDYPTAELARVYAVNVLAPVALVQGLRSSLATRHGWVVNLSSDAAVGGYPGWGGYGASKAALDLVSATLAHELAPEGITVVSVDPGDMRTTMHQSAFPGEDISDRPLPEATLPFWAWLLHQDPARLSGHRFRAQADRWEVPE